MSRPAATFIVRARDKAATIETTLRSIRAQDIPAELIVVDSGSTDGTRAIAARYADRVLDIPAADFTYGGALNVGAGAARGDVHAALSAHCVLPGPDWLTCALARLDDPRVAAVNGERRAPDGAALAGPLRQDAAHARAHWGWGFSNHASAWRAGVWAAYPFDERLGACEDKEWAFRVLAAGWEIVFDPALTVGGGHRKTAGARAYFGRMRRESAAFATFAPVPELSLAGALRRWWTPPPGGHPLRSRVSALRAAEVAGIYAGRRAGHRARRAGS